MKTLQNKIIDILIEHTKDYNCNVRPEVFEKIEQALLAAVDQAMGPDDNIRQFKDDFKRAAMIGKNVLRGEIRANLKREIGGEE